MAKLNRRSFLQMAVSGGTVGLVTPLAGMILPRSAHAFTLSPGPSRLLTIYMPGGWMPSMFFTPYRTEAEASVNFPTYLAQPSDITNLDGSGNAPDTNDPSLPRVRVPAIWNEAVMSDPNRFASGWPSELSNPRQQYGYSWKHYNLAENTCVVQGVDMQTAEHLSGRRACLSGIAGAKYSVPAFHAVMAHAHKVAGRSDRPLGAVTVRTGSSYGPTPSAEHLHLPAHAAETSVTGLTALERNFSQRTSAWNGLGHRDEVAVPPFNGDPGSTTIPLTRMDQFALARMRQFRGLADESFYEKLYDTYSIFSKKMALDLVTVIESTSAWSSPLPHYITGGNPWELKVGLGYGDTGGTWRGQFELALKLLKADLCSAINIQADGPFGEGFDIHSNDHAKVSELTRGVSEMIGRLLGEMKSTDIGGGQTLLDDTLVLLVSEFGRIFPMSNTSGHWPITSFVCVGGGIMGNRMVGDYGLSTTTAQSPLGAPVPVEGGTKIPTSRDFARTVYRILGIPDTVSEIFGGPSEILGVRAT